MNVAQTGITVAPSSPATGTRATALAATAFAPAIAAALAEGARPGGTALLPTLSSTPSALATDPQATSFLRTSTCSVLAADLVGDASGLVATRAPSTSTFGTSVARIQASVAAIVAGDVAAPASFDTATLSATSAAANARPGTAPIAPARPVAATTFGSTDRLRLVDRLSGQSARTIDMTVATVEVASPPTAVATALTVKAPTAANPVVQATTNDAIAIDPATESAAVESLPLPQIATRKAVTEPTTETAVPVPRTMTEATSDVAVVAANSLRSPAATAPSDRLAPREPAGAKANPVGSPAAPDKTSAHPPSAETPPTLSKPAVESFVRRQTANVCNDIGTGKVATIRRRNGAGGGRDDKS